MPYQIKGGYGKPGAPMVSYSASALEMKVTKPLDSEFEVSEAGVRHRPTGERFVPYPGKPLDGSWRDGHLNSQEEYDQDEVRTLGRKLWAQFIVSRL